MSVSPELILLLRENPSLTLTDQPSKLKKVTLSSVYHQLCQQGSAGTASAVAVAGHFVPCPLRNLPLRTTQNNRPTSSYHLYLPVRTTSTYHFAPTTSYLQLRTTFFKMFYVGRWSLLAFWYEVVGYEVDMITITLLQNVVFYLFIVLGLRVLKQH